MSDGGPNPVRSDRIEARAFDNDLGLSLLNDDESTAEWALDAYTGGGGSNA